MRPDIEKHPIGEKDLSDGRDEMEKIKQQLAADEERQIEERRKMDEWKAKQAPATDDANSKLRAELMKNTNVGDSSQSAPKSSAYTESYSSNEFDDFSASGSGTHKAAAQPLKKIEESSDVYEDSDFESLSRSQ